MKKKLINKLNMVQYFYPDLRKEDIEYFGNDPVVLSFYYVLKEQYNSDKSIRCSENFEILCIYAADDIYAEGLPDSIKELKEITDYYFKGKIEKSTLKTLFNYLNNKEIPNGVLV